MRDEYRPPGLDLTHYSDDNCDHSSRYYPTFLNDINNKDNDDESDSTVWTLSCIHLSLCTGACSDLSETPTLPACDNLGCEYTDNV